MFDKVFKTLNDNDLLQENDRVLVAFSGGPDSTALLHLLIKLKSKLKFDISAVHVNHNIRKEEALKDEKFCKKFCEKYKITFHLVSENIPQLAKKEKTGIEETARNFRLKSFNKLCNEYNYNKIAMGHHADDQVETVLFRLFRGSGRTGLKGISIKRGKIIRPLLETKQSEILSYLKKYKIKFVEDSSNFDNYYQRNFIRNELIPLIKKKINPSVDKAIINFSESILLEDDFLDFLTNKAVQKVVRVTPGRKFQLDLNLFNNYDLWLKRRLLRFCLLGLSKDKTMPDKEIVSRLVSLIEKNGKEISLPGKIQAKLDDKELILFERLKNNYQVKLPIGETVSLNLPEYKFYCRKTSLNSIKKLVKRNVFTIFLDYNLIKFPIYIRNINPGDRCRFLGMKGSKKISNYLIDKKIPKVFRDEIPLLFDQTGIIWLVGCEIADRVKVNNNTMRVLKIGCTRR